MRVLQVLSVVLLVSLTTPELGSAQVVQRVSSVARGDRRRHSRSRRRRSRQARPRRRSRDTDVLEAFFILFFGPVFATGDRWGSEWWLADHPYADDVPGYALYLTERDASAPPVQDIAMSVSAEGGYVVGGAGRGALDVRLMLPERFEIDVGAMALIERRAPGDWDTLGMETLHVGLRFAQDLNWQFHTGIGARLLHHEEGATAGFDFRYGFDVFPARPWIVSTRVSLGHLGWSWTVGARLTVGLALGPAEVFVGYDHFSVFDLEDETNSAHVSGPVGGLRLWI